MRRPGGVDQYPDVTVNWKLHFSPMLHVYDSGTGKEINSIGLSMGLLIWGSTNMLMGWATGRFGLFGTHADALARRVLAEQHELPRY